MNGMNYKPYINRLLTSLNAEKLKELQDLVNVQKKDTIYRDLNSITDADKGVGLYTILLDIRLIATGYLIYNDQYCTLLGFSNTSGRVIIYELNLGEKTYRVVNEYLTVDYLRHEIDVLNLAVSGGGLTEAEIQEAIADGSIVTSNIVHIDMDYMPDINEQHLEIEITNEQYNSIRNNPNTVIEVYDDNFPRTLYFYRVNNSGRFETISTDEGEDLFVIDTFVSGDTKKISIDWHSTIGAIQFYKIVTNNTFSVSASEFAAATDSNNGNVLLILKINDNHYTLNKSAVDANSVTFSSDKYIAKFNYDGTNYSGTVEEVASGGTKLYYHEMRVWLDSEHTQQGIVSFISSSSTPLTHYYDLSNVNQYKMLANAANYYAGEGTLGNPVVSTSMLGDHIIVVSAKYDTTNHAMTYIEMSVYGFYDTDVVTDYTN